MSLVGEEAEGFLTCVCSRHFLTEGVGHVFCFGPRPDALFLAFQVP